MTSALEKPDTGVVLDDLQARKCAELFEISLIGTLGLVVSAKRKGVIAVARPVIERLIAVGLYISSALLTNILVGIGEADQRDEEKS